MADISANVKSVLDFLVSQNYIAPNKNILHNKMKSRTYFNCFDFIVELIPRNANKMPIYSLQRNLMVFLFEKSST